MSDCKTCAGKHLIGKLFGCDGVYYESCYYIKLVKTQTNTDRAKPLNEWTLLEAKTECASRGSFSEPTFCPLRDDNGECRIGHRHAPDRFKLTEEDD